MDVLLTQHSIAMLNAILNNPRQLQPEAQIVVYKAPDPLAALEIVALIRWLESKVMEKQPNGKFSIPVAGWKGAVSKKSQLRLKDIVKHYEQWGLLTPNCIPYMELVYGLDGKSLDSDIVDVEMD